MGSCSLWSVSFCPEARPPQAVGAPFPRSREPANLFLPGRVRRVSAGSSLSLCPQQPPVLAPAAVNEGTGGDPGQSPPAAAQVQRAGEGSGVQRCDGLLVRRTTGPDTPGHHPPSGRSRVLGCSSPKRSHSASANASGVNYDRAAGLWEQDEAEAGAGVPPTPPPDPGSGRSQDSGGEGAIRSRRQRAQRVTEGTTSPALKAKVTLRKGL